jgi:hypothetical protein
LLFKHPLLLLPKGGEFNSVDTFSPQSIANEMECLPRGCVRTTRGVAKLSGGSDPVNLSGGPAGFRQKVLPHPSCILGLRGVAMTSELL